MKSLYFYLNLWPKIGPYSNHSAAQFLKPIKQRHLLYSKMDKSISIVE